MTMRGHAAASMVSTDALNGIGRGMTDAAMMEFNGSSFIAGPTGARRAHRALHRGRPARDHRSRPLPARPDQEGASVIAGASAAGQCPRRVVDLSPDTTIGIAP